MTAQRGSLRAGDLRHRVTILNPVEIDNGRGGRKTEFQDGATIWSEVTPLRGDEALANGIQRGTQLWRVTIRVREGVTIKHRLRWRGVEMNIRTCAPNACRDGLVMTTESGTAG